MTTKQRIIETLDQLDDDKLEEVYELIHRVYEADTPSSNQPSLMVQLRQLTPNQVKQ